MGLTLEQRQAAVARLRALMNERYEGNQTLVAKALGVTQPYVSELLAGGANPGTALLLRLSKALGTSVEGLLEGAPPGGPPSSASEDAEAPGPGGPWPSAVPEGVADGGEVHRSFAERLRWVFDASGLTHAAFAARSKLSHGALSVVLKRSSDPSRPGPSIATVAAMAKGLGVSPGWLAFGEGPDPVVAPAPTTTEEHLARLEEKKRSFEVAKRELAEACEALAAHLKGNGS